jgi:hypothetical protein
VSAKVSGAETRSGPWNPGIRSPVPEQLRQFCTVFLPANSFTGFSKARELHDLTGLDASELASFRPQRLVLHELLIRVTADLSVPDGERIADLGIKFREITRVILARYLEPRMDAITASFDVARRELAELIEAELANLMSAPDARVSGTSSPGSAWATLFGRRKAIIRPPRTPRSWSGRLVSEWTMNAGSGDGGLKRSAYGALVRLVSAILKRHGGPWGTRELLGSIAIDMACNDFGSEVIGRAIEPLVREAARSEGYMLLPRQEWPVIMNTKGPSASGKSTLRPLQRQLAGRIGATWRDFALISPDIWRKQLLDYDALGANYKYAGSFTGEELQIIDQKLDRYMAHKAQCGEVPHLLIDRFRFDSFAADSDEAGSNLLTRFGHIIYLFFLITPPGSLVERAWDRGLEFGRYKAVDDTLAHGVEAYAGMPELFFTWVQRADKRVHFEFLDNSVARGERPLTVAFGGNETLNVLDIKCLLDIERYRRINVDAMAPESLYGPAASLAPEENLEFLRRCVERFREVNFADQASGRIYLSMLSGIPVWVDRQQLEGAAANPDSRAALHALAPAAFDGTVSALGTPKFLANAADAGMAQTLGRWGIRT